jgi:hypothetical protein
MRFRSQRPIVYALIAIWACQAGGRTSRSRVANPWEDANSSRDEITRRIVQHGTPRRSTPALIEAIHHLHSGVWRDHFGARRASDAIRSARTAANDSAGVD